MAWPAVSAAIGVTIGLWAASPHAAGLTALHVGTPAQVNFTFLPLHVGEEKGVFARYGLDVAIVAFGGGPPLNQAFVTGDIDLAITSGTDMVFTAKGVPDLAVAATAGPPLYLDVIVPYSSPLKGPGDLKGQRIAVSTGASFSAWLMRRLMEEKHWDPNSMTLVSVGGNPQAYVAALKTGEVDAAVQSPALAFQLEERHEGRLLFPASEIVHAFMANAIFASDSMLKEHPDEVRRFIRGWFDTIAFMRGHKGETVAIERALTHYDEEVASKEYDTVMPMFLAKGTFDPAALAALAQSFVEMGLVAVPPDMSKLYSEAYLPKE
jgi:NitT/TauT family transport system substrate-binding protein